MRKKLAKNKFKFASAILVVMLANLLAAILGLNETIVVGIFCVCILSVLLDDLYVSVPNKESQQQDKPLDLDMDLDSFFRKGGVAYRWNKGDKERKECYSIDKLFDGEKYDYVELWLGNNRYYIKDMEDEKVM